MEPYAIDLRMSAISWRPIQFLVRYISVEHIFFFHIPFRLRISEVKSKRPVVFSFLFILNLNIINVEKKINLKLDFCSSNYYLL